MLLAQLTVLTSRGEIESLATRLAVMRRLARAGYSHEQIGAVRTFLDGVIALPEEVEARVEAQLEEEAMPEVMSHWEARVFQRGQDLGQEKLVLEQLNRQCGTLPDDIAAQVRDLTPEQQTDLALALLRFSKLADLTAWLSEHAPVTS